MKLLIDDAHMEALLMFYIIIIGRKFQTGFFLQTSRPNLRTDFRNMHFILVSANGLPPLPERPCLIRSVKRYEENRIF